VLDVLRTWRTLLLPPAKEAALGVLLHEHAVVSRAELARTTGRGFLTDTVGGLHYDPASLDRLLMVSSPGVVPIVVVVDGRSSRVILHPPRRALEGEAAPSARLLQLSRALGDRTRLGLLTRLRDGEMTAVELARAMRAPRTTLLHHLAILRSAGLVHVAVTPGEATVYRLRPEGLTELSETTTAFLAERRGVE
jgi:DNA-binding transcriptional ArsR family regulator